MDPRPPKPNANAGARRAAETTAGTVVQPHHNRPAFPDAFLAPAQKPDEIGRLGPYRVLAELGRGGMGIVFRAEDPRLKRAVAVKVLLPELAADPRAKARFVREAQAQAKVEHDHIIVIHEVEEADGVAFIVMPLLKGQTLAQALKQNPRPPLAELVRIGREIAEGLAAAHAAGLIHRDIKPGNIWLESSKRRVKILDFGLARNTDAAVAVAASDPQSAGGGFLGTPAYMPPEQARGKPTDPRSDLFSLGVVLYQMATGKLPFTGPSAFDVMAAVVTHEPPAARELSPDLPPALSDLIRRLMAKEPAGRPESADAVVKELEAIERGLAILPVQVFPLSAVADESNPWAEIETTHADEVVATAPRTLKEKPVRVPDQPPSLKWRWRVAGGLGVLLVGVLVVLAVNAFKPKAKTQVAEEKQTPNQKDDKKRTSDERDKPGKTVVEPSRADRDIAEWILTRDRSKVVVKLPNGDQKSVTKSADLPPGPFAVVGIELKTPLSDADVKRLEPLAQLRTLHLDEGHTLTTDGLRSLLVHKGRLQELCLSVGPITEERLKVLVQLTELEELDLDGTSITDDNLKHLLGLKKLKRLYLSDTGVSNNAFDMLAQMKSLTNLYLNNTKVDEAGAKKIADALPGCRVEWGKQQVIEAKDVTRQVATWLLERGYSVHMRLQDKSEFAAGNIGYMPKGPFTIIDVSTAGKPLTNEVAEQVARLPSLAGFRATVGFGHQLTEDGLKRLLKHKDTLVTLALTDGPVSEEGLKIVGQLTNLGDLGLVRTGVTNAGLEHLTTLQKLQRLNLRGTNVTEAGVKKLQAALSTCTIDWDRALSGGLAFDGKSTFVRVPNLKFDGKLPITIEAWITPKTVDKSDRHIILLGEPGGGIGVGGEGLAFGAGLKTDIGWTNDYTRIALKADETVHVAAVLTGERFVLYVNGKEAGTKKGLKLGQLPATKAPTLIGKATEFAGGSGYFHGTIHRIRVSRSVRYEKDFAPAVTWEKDDNTLLLYLFDDGTGMKLTDRSGQGYHGAIENGRWVEPKAP